MFEADIEACFDQIDHSALLGRVRHRIGDKRVLGWVTAFLKAGVLSEDGLNRETITGTPQGGILSPLLANIALSVLDEHFAAKWAALGPEWTRVKHRRAGQPVMKLVRYADEYAPRGIRLVAINSNDPGAYPAEQPAKMFTSRLHGDYLKLSGRLARSATAG